ncbi:hypothetical protein PVL29_010432 [Vitis rotundifolia]|uniref:Uncharacterized protein n=1 Tax=Vitis rotundifolia TaxID=103349 RepID=A0AA39DTF4_VITRO|nr:hypothetical protein PVL29_010427 [Vitis rotundifolia]KAJ9694945.1 hypothetical protein PVL29_010432 [Vitis rotundifolia]
MFITQIGPNRDLRPNELGLGNREMRITNCKLSKPKSISGGFGCCRCNDFWLKLNSRQPQIMVCDRRF